MGCEMQARKTGSGFNLGTPDVCSLVPSSLHGLDMEVVSPFDLEACVTSTGHFASTSSRFSRPSSQEIK